jgi:glycosyltransferase involved in cell wall biosynthesis
VARLLNHLDRTAVQPLLICLDRNGTAADWVQVDDVQVIELHKRSGNDPRVVGKMARLLRREGVELVHSHNWGTLVETSLARRWARVPYHVHAERGTVLGSVDHVGWRSRMRAAVTRRILSSCDAILAVSESVRGRLSDRCHIDRSRVEIIANGVDVPAVDNRQVARSECRRQLGISDDTILIGSVGRLAPVKNFRMAVKALEILSKRDLNCQLVLVGDGPQREQLAAWANEAGIQQQVHLVGQQASVGPWLAAMDIFINTSVSEGMSQAILEAMALGLPMVVTDVGENARLVEDPEGCGDVIPSEDHERLAVALDSLVRDPERRRKLSQRAITRHRNHYTIGVMVQRYQQLYGRLAAGTQEESS